MRLEIHVELHTRWHVGTGRGDPALTDAALVTEGGLPVLPGSTLKGLARDHASLVAAGTSADETGLTEQIFGSARRPGNWHFGTARPAETDPTRLFELSRHNRHDPSTGRVADNFLFDYQIAQPVSLTAVVVTRDDAEPGAAEVAFLALTLASVDRLGARRSRGWGRCRIRVTDAATGADLASLAEPLLVGS